jgi:hypothetical protein
MQHYPHDRDIAEKGFDIVSKFYSQYASDPLDFKPCEFLING